MKDLVPSVKHINKWTVKSTCIYNLVARFILGKWVKALEIESLEAGVALEAAQTHQHGRGAVGGRRRGGFVGWARRGAVGCRRAIGRPGSRGGGGALSHFNFLHLRLGDGGCTLLHLRLRLRHHLRLVDCFVCRRCDLRITRCLVKRSRGKTGKAGSTKIYK